MIIQIIRILVLTLCLSSYVGCTARKPHPDHAGCPAAKAKGEGCPYLKEHGECPHMREHGCKTGCSEAKAAGASKESGPGCGCDQYKQRQDKK